MANRCLLHKKKLEALRWWLTKEGWELLPTKRSFEVLRAKKDGKLFIVFDKSDASAQHYTVNDEDVKLVRKFLKGIKNYKNEMKKELSMT